MYTERTIIRLIFQFCVFKFKTEKNWLNDFNECIEPYIHTFSAYLLINNKHSIKFGLALINTSHQPQLSAIPEKYAKRFQFIKYL